MTSLIRWSCHGYCHALEGILRQLIGVLLASLIGATLGCASSHDAQSAVENDNKPPSEAPLLKDSNNQMGAQYSPDDAPYPGPDKKRLHDLLSTHKFEELAQYLEQLRATLVSGPIPWNAGNDWLLTTSYMSISQCDAENERDLMEWINRFPDSSEANTALAFCYLKKSLDARGNAFIQDTSAKQLEVMDTLIKAANTCAQKALELNAQNPAPFRVLIRAARQHGSKNAVAVGTEALKRFPLSYLLRVHVMESLEPRWGGSYEAMIQFAEQSQQFAAANPAMKTLLGFPYWAKGRDTDNKRDFKGALELYQKALQYGPELDFYDGMIMMEHNLGMEAEAARDQKTEDRLFPH